jgi:hypothetical protein
MGEQSEAKRTRRPIRPPKRPSARLSDQLDERPGAAVQRRSALGTVRPEEVLALQQTAGNASVSRLVSGQSGDPTVQREPKEFHPLIFEPAAPIQLRVFQPYTHEWSIVNFDAAPRGSAFHWGYGIETDTVAVLKGSTTAHRGASTKVNVQARTPGTFAIQGTPVHQVPGGPEIQGDPRHARFQVAQPTLTMLSMMPRKADGSGADRNHLSVGDKLIVRVLIGGVDGKHMEDPSAAAVKGAPNADLVDFGKPVQSFPDGRSYDVEFVMNAPGTFDMSLELGIGDIALGKGPKAEHIQATVERDRQEFINLCNQCHVRIDQAYTQANSIMEVLSAAYGNAYDNHVTTLKAQDASNRLAMDILLGAALAFIPGGVGGVVGSWMKSKGAGDFLVDAVKDLAKAGTRGIQGAIVGPAIPGAGEAMRPMSKDPRTWRAEYNVTVNGEKKVALAQLDRWLTAANTKSPDFAMDFDPLETINAALTKDGKEVASLPVPDQAEHQKKFELGMWKEWLETFAYTAGAVVGYGGAQAGLVENTGKKIVNRLNDLGEDGDAWVAQYGGVAKRRAQESMKAKYK